MLGRLARWLRIAGYDTIYEPDMEDGEVIRLAIAGDRMILTRDTRLTERRAARGRSFLVGPDDPLEQIEEVLRAFPPPAGLQSRCPECNGEVLELQDREDAKDLVPEYVFLSKKEFFRCAACGHIYWEGSQYAKFKKKLNAIINKGNPLNP